MAPINATPLNAILRTVVFGAAGFIGNRFFEKYLASDPDCLGLDLRANARQVRAFDLRAPKLASLKLSRSGYSHALISAGITKIDLCERDRELSRAVNVTGTLELIHQLVCEGIIPVFLSSDYVFDGLKGGYQEDDPTNPTTEYGRHKAEVESQIGELTRGRHLVLRLSKVFSPLPGETAWIDEIVRELSARRVFRAAIDQIFCPLLIDDLIFATLALQRKGAQGLVNVCGPEALSRYDIAVALAKVVGADIDLVKAVSIDDICPPPRRPHNTSMRTDRLKKETGIICRPFASSMCSFKDYWLKQ